MYSSKRRKHKNRCQIILVNFHMTLLISQNKKKVTTSTKFEDFIFEIGRNHMIMQNLIITDPS